MDHTNGIGELAAELAQLRAALAQAQAERDAATRRAEKAEAVAARLRNALQDLYDDYQGKEMGSLLEARAALAGQEGNQ